MPLIRPIVFTALNSASFFILGMLTAQKGPSFNDLLVITDTDVDGGSFYVLASNLGFMLGSLLAGIIYERFKSKTMMIAIAVTLSGVFTILVPWCNVFAAMLIIQIVVSTFSSVYETVVTTEEVQAWDGSSQSALQFISFCYSVGGVIAPLITKPFLAPKATETTANNGSSIDSFTNMSSIPGCALATQEVDLDNGSLHAHVLNNFNCDLMTTNCTAFIAYACPYNLSTNGSVQNLNPKSNLHIAYLITGSLAIAFSMLFYVAMILSLSKKGGQRRQEEKMPPSTRKLSRKVFIGLIVLACSFFYFHSMGVDSFAQYIFYFVVTYLDWSKENGAYLVSMYWGLAMSSKLISVGLYRFVELGHTFLVNMSGIVVSIILFCIAAQFRVDILVWTSSATLAMSQAAAFGGGIAWVDGNLIKLDGKTTSVVMICGNLGAVVAPVPLGFLMKNVSMMAFPYSVTFMLCTGASIFLTMYFVVRPILNRKYGPLRPVESKGVSTEATGGLSVTTCVDSKANCDTESDSFI